MPPRKCTGQPLRVGHQTRSKRAWTSEWTATDPPVLQPAINNSSLVCLDINALFATMSTAISEALKTAMSKDSLTEIMRQNTVNVSMTYFGPFEPDVECLAELKAKASEE